MDQEYDPETTELTPTDEYDFAKVSETPILFRNSNRWSIQSVAPTNAEKKSKGKKRNGDLFIMGG